uniref:Cytochrome P450 n=1 Tax=Brassica oleracea var. oleracea TaxID=109376 RepID=A0A0D3BDM9_BRAOL
FCAYEIFTAHDVNFSSRNLPTNEGSILFDTSGFVTAPYGGYFKFMKKLIVTKLLGPNAQVQSRSIRADELERLRGILLDKGRKKESVDINKEARKLVGNIVARMTMGRSFTQENGDIESIQSLVAKANASKIKTALSVLIFGQLEKLGISWFKKRTVFKNFDRLLERFLRALAMEALRLHPPAPIIPREFNQGCTVGGFFLPEKTKLLVNVYAVMRDPNVWENPLEFKPERFLTSSSSGQEEKRKRQALKYLLFGSGRRGCPASSLAYMIVGTTIGMMVQCFDWSIKGEKVNMDECFKEFTRAMAYPLTFTPFTRISTFDLENSLNLQT